MSVCHYHRERPGIGVCMKCRAVICSACCTKLDGVNHCHACLKKLGRRPEARAATEVSATVLALGALGLAWLFFFGLLWWLLYGRLAV